MYIRIIIYFIALFFIFLTRNVEDNAVKKEFRRLLSSKKRDNYAEQHKDLIKKDGDKFYLSNARVSCEYSVSEITFKFENKKNPLESSYVQMDFNCFDMKECIKFLDFVLYSFNNKTDYSGLYYVFSTNPNFMFVTKNKPSELSKDFVHQNNILDEKVNINKACEEEIAKLPGVNIVKAKKVVQYRTLHNGFKDIDEFLKVAGVKANFKETVIGNVLLGRYVFKEVENDEREIDL